MKKLSEMSDQEFREFYDQQYINFELLYEEYLRMLDYYNRMIKYCTTDGHLHESAEFWEGFKFGCNKFFEWAKDFGKESFNPKMRTPTEAEFNKYKYTEKLYNVTYDDGRTERATEGYLSKISDHYTAEPIGELNWPLCGVIEYRDDIIPVYDDDYGQSMFARFEDGSTSGGGTYNLYPEQDFCFFYDQVHDKIH